MESYFVGCINLFTLKVDNLSEHEEVKKIEVEVVNNKTGLDFNSRSITYKIKEI